MSLKLPESPEPSHLRQRPRGTGSVTGQCVVRRQPNRGSVERSLLVPRYSARQHPVVVMRYRHA